jgi:hypothetical protein
MGMEAQIGGEGGMHDFGGGMNNFGRGTYGKEGVHIAA